MKREIEVSPSMLYGGQGSESNSTASESPTPTTNSQDASINGAVADDTTSDPSEETSLDPTTADLGPTSTSISANNHASLNTGAQPETGNGNVLSCVVEAIQLMEDVDGSQEDLLNIMRLDR